LITEGFGIFVVGKHGDQHFVVIAAAGAVGVLKFYPFAASPSIVNLSLGASANEIWPGRSSPLQNHTE
jgi:hypothetical protein